MAGCWNSWKSRKNLKVGGFETDFKQVPFVFRQTTSTYSESWGPVEKFFDPPPGGWVGGGQKMTQKLNFGSKNVFPQFFLKNLV